MNAEGVNECSQPLVSNPPPYTCQGYLGIIQTTWDQVATLFGAVFTGLRPRDSDVKSYRCVTLCGLKIHRRAGEH